MYGYEITSRLRTQYPAPSLPPELADIGVVLVDVDSAGARWRGGGGEARGDNVGVVLCHCTPTLTYSNFMEGEES